jgi:hypothetical protein
MAGVATLLAIPVLACAQGSAPAPRSNDASGGTLAQVATPTQLAAARAAAVDPAALRNGIRTNKVVGSSMYNEARDGIGKADEIIILLGGGAPIAVISVGGLLGIGSRYVAVPLSDLHLGPNGCWTLPPFSYDTTPTRGSPRPPVTKAAGPA